MASEQPGVAGTAARLANWPENQNGTPPWSAVAMFDARVRAAPAPMTANEHDREARNAICIFFLRCQPVFKSHSCRFRNSFSIALKVLTRLDVWELRHTCFVIDHKLPRGPNHPSHVQLMGYEVVVFVRITAQVVN